MIRPPRLHVPERQDFGLSHMTVINPEIDRLADQTIEVRGSRIERITSSGTGDDGTKSLSHYSGMYALPGLIEMHAHMLTQADFFSAVYLLHGVTTVRDCSNFPRIIRSVKRKVASGKMPGVRYFAAGLSIDGNPPVVGKRGSGVDTADEARARVRELAEQGVDFIKVYNNLPSEALAAVVETSKSLGLKVAGHLPLTVRFENAHMDAVEHLWGVPPVDPMPSTENYTHEEYVYAWKDVTPEVIQSYVTISREQGIAHTPTLVMYRGTALMRDYESALEDPNLKLLSRWCYEILWNPKYAPRFFKYSEKGYSEMDSMIEKQKQVVKALYDNDVPVFVGTDAPFFAIPGLGIHQELENFVECGLTPEQAWACATNKPGAFLDVPMLGTLQVGAPADLLVFREDPTKDLSNLYTLEGVVADGRLYSKAQLEYNFERIHRYYEKPFVVALWNMVARRMAKSMMK